MRVAHPAGAAAPSWPFGILGMDITELLAFSVKNKASDLHLSAELPPIIRLHGDVRRINLPPMAHEEVLNLLSDILNDPQRKEYEQRPHCDFAD